MESGFVTLKHFIFALHVSFPVLELGSKSL